MEVQHVRLRHRPPRVALRGGATLLPIRSGEEGVGEVSDHREGKEGDRHGEEGPIELGPGSSLDSGQFFFKKSGLGLARSPNFFFGSDSSRDMTRPSPIHF